jgi:hypothetical protein
MKPSRTIAAVVLACMTPAATGCYSYKPVGADEIRPEPGKQVRVHLNEPDRVRLQHITAEGVVQINGELAEWDNGEVVLSAFWLRSNTGFEHRAQGETVEVDEANIRSLEAKQINVPLSVAMVVGGVAAAVIIGSAFSAGGSGGNDGDNGGGGSQSRRGPRF